MRHGVQHRRLARPDADQGAAGGLHQILRHGIGELRALRREPEAPLQRRVARERRNLRREPAQQREPEAMHVGRFQAQAVIGVHSRHRQVAFDGVEPRHRPLFGVALCRPIAHRGKRPRQGREKVRVQRKHDARPGKIEARLVSAAVGELRSVVDLLQRDGAPGGEPGARIEVGQPLAQVRDERRGTGLHQEAQPLSAGVAQGPRFCGGGLEEVAPGSILAAVLHDLQALRVVQSQQLGLFQRPHRSAARGVIGIALDLRRPPFVGGDQEAGGAAVDGGRRRVVKRISGRHFRRLSRVRKDLFVRRLQASTEGGQRGRGAKELQHASPRSRVVGRCLGPQLP